MTAFSTQVILKNESFFNEDCYLDQEDSNNLNERERKCGEIIIFANTRFWFVCTFCDERFQSVLIFQTHIKCEHINDPENKSIKEDPLNFSKNEDDIIIKADVAEERGPNNQVYHLGISPEKCNEIEHCSNDFMYMQSDNEIEEKIEIETPTNKVTKHFINKELTLGEDIHSNDSKNLNVKRESENGALFSEDIEDSIFGPKKRNRKKKIYSCTLCQHIARNRNSLQGHLMSNHGTGTQHQCEECGKFFRTASNLKSHLIIHSGTRPYKCDFCDSGFSHPNSLRTHRYIHTGERPYKCNRCEKGFVSSTGLKIHEREHTGETPYVCQFCNRGYANKCHYNRHIISHSSRKAFECKLCEKAFKHRETFNKHMVCHTSEKNEVCDVCQKRFIHKKNLVQHKKIHSNVKQYTCKVCNKEFAQNAGLYSHMKYHKNKE